MANEMHHPDELAGAVQELRARLVWVREYL